jgi:hypothetical protein
VKSTGGPLRISTDPGTLHRQNPTRPFQEVSYDGDRRVRLHLHIEITEAVDAAGRGHTLGQAHRCQPSIRGCLHITLLAGSSKSIGELSQADLPGPREGLIE